MLQELTTPPTTGGSVSAELLGRFDVSGPRYTAYPTADRFVSMLSRSLLAMQAATVVMVFDRYLQSERTRARFSRIL